MSMEKDRVRVRLDFSVNGVKFSKGDWLDGQFVWAGKKLRFESDSHMLVPDYFDRCELDMYTVEETFGADLGVAEDRDPELDS